MFSQIYTKSHKNEMIKIESKWHFLKSVLLQEPSKQTVLIEEFKNTSPPSLFHNGID